MNKAVLGIVALLLLMGVIVYVSRGVLTPYLSRIRPRASFIPLPSTTAIVPAPTPSPVLLMSPLLVVSPSPRVRVITPSLAPRPSVLPAASQNTLPATGL